MGNKIGDSPTPSAARPSASGRAERSAKAGVKAEGATNADATAVSRPSREALTAAGSVKKTEALSEVDGGRDTHSEKRLVDGLADLSSFVTPLLQAKAWPDTTLSALGKQIDLALNKVGPGHKRDDVTRLLRTLADAVARPADGVSMRDWVKAHDWKIKGPPHLASEYVTLRSAADLIDKLRTAAASPIAFSPPALSLNEARLFRVLKAAGVSEQFDTLLSADPIPPTLAQNLLTKLSALPETSVAYPPRLALASVLEHAVTCDKPMSREMFHQALQQFDDVCVLRANGELTRLIDGRVLKTYEHPMGDGDTLEYDFLPAEHLYKISDTSIVQLDENLTPAGTVHYLDIAPTPIDAFAEAGGKQILHAMKSLTQGADALLRHPVNSSIKVLEGVSHLMHAVIDPSLGVAQKFAKGELTVADTIKGFKALGQRGEALVAHLQSLSEPEAARLIGKLTGDLLMLAAQELVHDRKHSGSGTSGLAVFFKPAFAIQADGSIAVRLAKPSWADKAQSIARGLNHSLVEARGVVGELNDISKAAQTALLQKLGHTLVHLRWLTGAQIERLAAKLGPSIMQLAPLLKGQGLLELEKLEFFAARMDPAIIQHTKTHGMAVRSLPPLANKRVADIRKTLKKAGFEKDPKSTAAQEVWTHKDGSVIRMAHQGTEYRPWPHLKKEIAQVPGAWERGEIACKVSDSGVIVPVENRGPGGAVTLLRQWFTAKIGRQSVSENELAALARVWADSTHMVMVP